MATNPDFREYVDLTINDVSPTDIYNAAVDYAALALPEFSPRQGTVEDAMLQAMSYISGIMTGAINRLPNALMQGVLGLMGFARISEVTATGSVIFTSIDSTGLSIPAGTQVAFTETTESGSIQHIFQTTATGTIPVGQTTSDPVAIVSIEAGEKPVITDGDPMLILTASNKLLSAAFSGTLTQGSAAETDADYFSRGVTYLQSLTSALATTNQIDAFILSTFREAYRVKTYDLTTVGEVEGVKIYETSGLIGASLQVNINTQVTPKPSAGSAIRIYGISKSSFNGVFTVDSVSASTSPESVIFFDNTVGASAGETYIENYQVELLDSVSYGYPNQLGQITTFVLDADGNPIAQAYRSSIEAAVQARTVAGLVHSVENALVLNFDVNATIAVQTGYVALDVRSAVDTVISAYLSPQQWDWSPIIRRNAIITRISQVPGVDYIDDLDITLTAGEPLAAIDGNGDIVFSYKGILPSANVTIGAL